MSDDIDNKATIAEIKDAINRLTNLCQDSPVRCAFAAFIEDGKTTEASYMTNVNTLATDGRNADVLAWAGALGYLSNARRCLKDANEVPEGVRLLIRNMCYNDED